jgi:hypothetical protein
VGGLQAEVQSLRAPMQFVIEGCRGSFVSEDGVDIPQRFI